MGEKIKKRMTGKDYRKEYDEMMKTEKSLYSHTTNRLRELLKLYPNACVDKRCTLHSKDVTEDWLNTMSLCLTISFICGIERWSEEQQGVQQLKI
jgi:hypothetical protein